MTASGKVLDGTPADAPLVPIALRLDAAASPSTWLMLAHGAGAPMDSSFMATLTDMLVSRGISVARFEFAYMAARRGDGKRRPPPRAERLCSEYETAISTFRGEVSGDTALFIGGKSMGGRVASMIARDQFSRGRVAGLVCLGYPFHPTKKPSDLRIDHLKRIDCPTLIVQGTRDPLGDLGEVEGYGLDRRIGFHWAADGDHDLGPRGGSGHTRRGNLEGAADAIANFMRAANGG